MDVTQERQRDRMRLKYEAQLILHRKFEVSSFCQKEFLLCYT